ncbi:Nucleotidylyl transferase superfamily protein [Perilla frutescens var. frutescens]|nr:Nucleotidylyl transferase superfamily protein [Perilla frutescens var. frutescens]
MMMGGCRISQQLREYNPRQFGSIKRCRFRVDKAAPPPRRSRFCSGRLFGFKLLGSNASFSSSSVASNDDDLPGLSFINNDASHPPLFSDCFSSAETGGDLPSERVSVAGGIVALGKFDALHIGHRELAIQAAKIGVPYLMSFVGMGEVLGWEPRAPVVAKCDRKRVLSSWAPFCGNVTPKECEVEFSQVRYLTPQQFVEKLAVELGVCGVVAGENYRFGYRAAGNSSDLVRLCQEYGMKARIINTVMDKHQHSMEMGSSNSHERGQVSSTRVRHALANGDMKYVSELLGRHHRVMVVVRNKEKIFSDRKRLSGKLRSCLLNLPPKEGLYENCSLVVGDKNVAPCRVTIDSTYIHLELDEVEAPHINTSAQNLLLGIDFGESKV